MIPFESEMVKCGFEFRHLETEEKIKVYEVYIQQNFDILFNKKRIDASEKF
jgi:uncharacterized protein YcsI (UPF0317 family)